MDIIGILPNKWMFELTSCKTKVLFTFIW